MKIFSHILFAFVCIVSFGCTSSEEDLIDPLEFIVTKENFGYDNYQSYDLVSDEEAVSFLVGQDRYVYYSTFGRKIKVLNTTSNQIIVLLDDAYVSEIETKDGDVYFCTNKGIYRVQPDSPLELNRIGESCYNIEVLDDDRILFTTIQSVEVNDINRVFKLENGKAVPFTILLPSLVGQFKRLSTGELLVFPSGALNMIYRLNAEGEVITTYSDEDSPLPNYTTWDRLWMEETEKELIVVGKNGLGYPDVFTWSKADESWTNLLKGSVLEEVEESTNTFDLKLSYIRKPSYTDIMVYNNQLYIATNFAGCLGIQKFNLDGSVPFNYDDISIIQDERIGEDQCIQGMYFSKRDDCLYIYTQERVVKFN